MKKIRNYNVYTHIVFGIIIYYNSHNIISSIVFGSSVVASILHDTDKTGNGKIDSERQS